jgi:predicted ester cyclase
VIRDGRISQTTSLIDILDVIRQAGFWPVAPSMGVEEMWPGPLTGDGILLADADPAVSAASIAQTLAMHGTLGAYNDELMAGRDGLLAMPQREHWHPRMMWYGPAGIGTTRGLAGFVDDHQLPFRIAFPNRKGGNHYVRIGDGNYSATGGWPSVYATHRGGDFMGLSPTGRDVTMRVMDFYLHHEGLIRENWVPLDIIHLLLQMDVDVFARMRSFFQRGHRFP